MASNTPLNDPFNKDVVMVKNAGMARVYGQYEVYQSQYLESKT